MTVEHRTYGPGEGRGIETRDYYGADAAAVRGKFPKADPWQVTPESLALELAARNRLVARYKREADDRYQSSWRSDDDANLFEWRDLVIDKLDALDAMLADGIDLEHRSDDGPDAESDLYRSDDLPALGTLRTVR